MCATTKTWQAMKETILFRSTRGNKESSLEGDPGDNYRAEVEVNKFVTVSVQYIDWNISHFSRLNLQFITEFVVKNKVWLLLLMRLNIHSFYWHYFVLN